MPGAEDALSDPIGAISDVFSDPEELFKDVTGISLLEDTVGTENLDLFTGKAILDPAIESITGEEAAKAAEEAAAIQAAAGTDAVANLRQAQIEAAARQQPFEQFGVTQGIGALPGSFGVLQSAINDPTAGVIDNPFFQALSADQDQRLLASRAARGKVGSGGTEDALLRQQLLLGNQFSQQNIGNIQGQIQNQFNAAAIGQNAASQTGVQGLQTAGNVGGILGNIANAQAAGVIGQQQASAQGFQNLVGLGSLIAAPFTGGASLAIGAGGGLLGGGSSPPPNANFGQQFA